MAAMFDDIGGKIDNVVIFLDPTVAKFRTPSHTIQSIAISKLEGHLKGGQIERSLPFEIECSVVPDPQFMAWNFRVNKVIVHGKPVLFISRMSWREYLQFTEYEPMARQIY